MKTTTYLASNGHITTTVTDQPELTAEQYREACRVIREAAKPRRFTLAMFGDGLEWMRPVSLETPNRKYRVTIEWKLDHYGIYVELIGDSRYRAVRAHHDYTAIEHANRLLRAYSARA